MRKSLILALTAIGGGVGYAAGVTEVATGPSTDDSSTWRWHVSSILAAQSDTGSRRMEVGVLGAEVFNQRYERYKPSAGSQSRSATPPTTPLFRRVSRRGGLEPRLQRSTPKGFTGDRRIS